MKNFIWANPSKKRKIFRSTSLWNFQRWLTSKSKNTFIFKKLVPTFWRNAKKNCKNFCVVLLAYTGNVPFVSWFKKIHKEEKLKTWRGNWLEFEIKLRTEFKKMKFILVPLTLRNIEFYKHFLLFTMEKIPASLSKEFSNFLMELAFKIYDCTTYENSCSEGCCEMFVIMRSMLSSLWT